MLSVLESTWEENEEATETRKKIQLSYRRLSDISHGLNKRVTEQKIHLDFRG